MAQVYFEDINEGEEIEVALRITNHTLEFVDLKQAQIAVVILDSLLLQFAALLGREFIIFAPFCGADGTALMINQAGFAVMGALPVGPAFHLHLQETEVDPELQLFTAIQPGNFPDFDRAGFVRPFS